MKRFKLINRFALLCSCALAVSKKAAFTLAEGATHVDMHNSSRKAAFTLAEVLITLGIIGVVAAITLPQFIQDMSERINSNRQANIAQKVTKAVEMMIINGEYTGITTTDEFVDKLQKYLKISKRCNSEHIADCWPVPVVKSANGNKYEVQDAKTGKNLHTKSNEKNVGLVLVDGAFLILTFDPSVKAISGDGGFISVMKALPVGGAKTKDFAYTSNATDAIDFIMDVNGGAGPNAEPDNDGNYYDIRSFKKASFTSTNNCTDEYNGMCLVDLGKSYKAVDCTKSENRDYCEAYGVSNSNLANDYWAGAIKACKDIGMSEIDQTLGRTLALNGYLNNSLDYYWTTSNFTAMKQDGTTAFNFGTKSHQFNVMCVK